MVFLINDLIRLEAEVGSIENKVFSPFHEVGSIENKVFSYYIYTHFTFRGYIDVLKNTYVYENTNPYK